MERRLAETSGDGSDLNWQLWLLAVEALVFLAFAVGAALQFRYLVRGRNGTASMMGGRMRDVFVALLACACLARAVSLSVLLYTLRYSSLPLAPTGPSANSGVDMDKAVFDKLWGLYLLESIPSLVFLAAYSLVVLFWAQVFYATILVAADSLCGLFLFGNGSMLTLFVASALLTRFPRDANRLKNAVSLLLGGYYILVGGLFAYYGVQVASQLTGESRHTRTRASIVRRIVLLSVVCPLLFEVRGILAVASVLGATSNGDVALAPAISPWGWDAIVYFLTELLPVLLILQVFSPPPHVTAAAADAGSAPSAPAALQTPLLDGSFVETFRRRQWYLPPANENDDDFEEVGCTEPGLIDDTAAATSSWPSKNSTAHHHCYRQNELAEMNGRDTTYRKHPTAPQQQQWQSYDPRHEDSTTLPSQSIIAANDRLLMAGGGELPDRGLVSTSDKRRRSWQTSASCDRYIGGSGALVTSGGHANNHAHNHHYRRRDARNMAPENLRTQADAAVWENDQSQRFSDTNIQRMRRRSNHDDDDDDDLLGKQPTYLHPSRNVFAGIRRDLGSAAAKYSRHNALSSGERRHYHRDPRITRLSRQSWQQGYEAASWENGPSRPLPQRAGGVHESRNGLNSNYWRDEQASGRAIFYGEHN